MGALNKEILLREGEKVISQKTVRENIMVLGEYFERFTLMIKTNLNPSWNKAKTKIRLERGSRIIPIEFYPVNPRSKRCI